MAICHIDEKENGMVNIDLGDKTLGNDADITDAITSDIRVARYYAAKELGMSIELLSHERIVLVPEVLSTEQVILRDISEHGGKIVVTFEMGAPAKVERL